MTGIGSVVVRQPRVSYLARHRMLSPHGLGTKRLGAEWPIAHFNERLDATLTLRLEQSLALRSIGGMGHG